MSKSHARETRLQRAVLSAQAWLLLGTVIACGVVGYLTFIKAPDGKSAAAMLPKPVCARGSAAPLSSAYPSANFRIIYSTTGCDAAAAYAPLNASNQIAEYETALGTLGLQAAQTPVTVALGGVVAGGEQTFPVPGQPGAIEIATSGNSASANPLMQGLAELSLADTATGLTAHSRRRVASAFAMLGSLPQAASSAEHDLRAGRFSADADGVYDAWLAARYGRTVLFSALNECRQSCDWPTALASALTGIKASEPKLLAQFVSRATTPAYRSALSAELSSDS